MICIAKETKKEIKKIDVNPELKNIDLRMNYGCAILTYEVTVPADFKLLEQIHKSMREAIIKRISDEVEVMNEKMFKDMDEEYGYNDRKKETKDSTHGE